MISVLVLMGGLSEEREVSLRSGSGIYDALKKVGYQAKTLDLNREIIGIINKIDLPGAEPEKVKQEMEDVLGIDQNDIIAISAKMGLGIEEVLEAIVKQIPAPLGDEEGPLQALIFDSYFDSYQGAISYIRVVNGRVQKGDLIQMMSSGKQYEVSELGVINPYMTPVPALKAGEVGYLVAGIKNVVDTRVGDTITGARKPAPKPLPGYQEVKPMVYCGLYPLENNDFEKLRDALDKLKLNDSSLFYEPESSDALGFGFRCGFLGLLHLEIVRERLEREYDLSLMATAPVQQILQQNPEQSLSVSITSCDIERQELYLLFHQPVKSQHKPPGGKMTNL
jgi:GTP-binding protein LepA